MYGPKKRVLTDYIAAFSHYGGSQKVFHTKPFGGHALVNDGVYVYQVSHYKDLLGDYERYFSTDMQEIYLQFPAEIWSVFLNELLSIDEDDLIIEFYQSWKKYASYLTTDPVDLDLSLVKFNKMISDFQHGADVVEAALTDETLLIPIIALAIKDQFEDPSLFFKECLLLMTSRFVDQMGDGLIFVIVGPEGLTGSSIVTKAPEQILLPVRITNRVKTGHLLRAEGIIEDILPCRAVPKIMHTRISQSLKAG